ncbi:AraC family transcriptional regulator ligand-binding domain-containing protein [Pseudoalteromonas carrageenovora]|uniref:AraC family transcriptional regulator n=1 Tax=Pseudoalteromonas TaxID=53246 RepID=UPI0026E13937|nr:AraC family transcriptional regulator ligand-binding domain-containing protein [Pseudoalteromonas carrageenovora]MDO6636133.1 AraC family transcriptional regulator ligand-binding domain-containing protein [Pseudoalteromonas carrageenovora]MDO6648461.1 AraC family transcriptional regulator ligand-binding domain-containing protein [Pseudoalteromonas carrageenovora]
MQQYISLDDKYLSAEGIITALVELAQGRGIPLHKLLRGTGIFEQDLYDLSQCFSLSQLLALICQFKTLMKSNDSGFLLGHQLVNDVSPTMQSVRLSPTLGAALKQLQQIRATLAPLFFTRGHIFQEDFYLYLQPSIGMDESLKSYCFEIYSAAFISLLKRVSSHYPHCYFDFTCKRPRHIQEYEQHLGLRVRFEQPYTRWHFDKQLLKCANSESSALRWQQCVAQSELHKNVSQSFVEAVCQRIYRDKNNSLANSAEYFAMSPATFKRKLKQHGVSYSQLQDEQNKLKALHLLGVRQQGNEQVAMRLAFYDIPNFRRAFKRWTGITPSQLKI